MVRCKYPSGNINEVQNKAINGNQEGNGIDSMQVGSTTQGISTSSGSGQDTTSPRGRPSKGHIVIKHICTKYEIQAYFKGSSTISKLMVRPKDKDPKEKASEVIYSYQ